MSLFDPYSHTRLFELRQEQLARKAKRRQQLGIDTWAQRSARQALLESATSLSAFLNRSRRNDAPQPTATGRPALDS